jgi:hypothetical protein
MVEVLFEYPSNAIAQDRATEFRGIPKAVVRVAGRRIGVIMNPRDYDQATRLLDRIPDSESVGWDPREVDGALTLDEGMAGILGGFLFGGIVGALKYLANRGNGIPDHTTSLRLTGSA